METSAIIIWIATVMFAASAAVILYLNRDIFKSSENQKD